MNYLKFQFVSNSPEFCGGHVLLPLNTRSFEGTCLNKEKMELSERYDHHKLYSWGVGFWSPPPHREPLQNKSPACSTSILTQEQYQG